MKIKEYTSVSTVSLEKSSEDGSGKRRVNKRLRLAGWILECC